MMHLVKRLQPTSDKLLIQYLITSFNLSQFLSPTKERHSQFSLNSPFLVVRAAGQNVDQG